MANIAIYATLTSRKEPEEEGWEVCPEPGSAKPGRPSLPLEARIASSTESIKTQEELQEIELHHNGMELCDERHKKKYPE